MVPTIEDLPYHLKLWRNGHAVRQHMLFLLSESHHTASAPTEYLDPEFKAS